MKRVMAAVLVMLAMTVLLTGCGANPVGSYVTATVNGQAPDDYIESIGATLETLEINTAQELMTMEIRADGTFTAKMSGSDPREGTWKRDGNKLEMTVGDAVEMFTMNGEELSYKTDSLEIVFAKESTT